VDHVVAIYARENGQGMAFPVPTESGAGVAAPTVSEPAAPRPPRLALTEAPAHDAQSPGDESPPEPPAGGRPSLKRVK
jgi:stringent starvation protein B